MGDKVMVGVVYTLGLGLLVDGCVIIAEPSARNPLWLGIVVCTGAIGLLSALHIGMISSARKRRARAAATAVTVSEITSESEHQ